MYALCIFCTENISQLSACKNIRNSITTLICRFEIVGSRGVHSLDLVASTFPPDTEGTLNVLNYVLSVAVYIALNHMIV